jgi:hypothetical protein
MEVKFSHKLKIWGIKLGWFNLARETRVRNETLMEERDVTLSVIRDLKYMVLKLLSHTEQMKEKKITEGLLKRKSEEEKKCPTHIRKTCQIHYRRWRQRPHYCKKLNMSNTWWDDEKKRKKTRKEETFIPTIYVPITWISYCKFCLYLTHMSACYMCNSFLPAYRDCNIVTCEPFLGSELASVLLRRDRFLETNWLQNMNMKTESCKLMKTSLLLKH